MVHPPAVLTQIDMALKPLCEEARALLDAARRGGKPTALERARVLRRIERALADERLASRVWRVATPLASDPPPGPVSRRGLAQGTGGEKIG